MFIVSEPQEAGPSVHVQVSMAFEASFSLSHVLSCHSIGSPEVCAMSTEDTNPVPLVLSSNMVMYEHKLSSVLGYKDVSLMSVTDLFSHLEVHLFSGAVLLLVTTGSELSPPRFALSPRLFDPEGWTPAMKKMGSAACRDRPDVVAFHTLTPSTSCIVSTYHCLGTVGTAKNCQKQDKRKELHCRQIRKQTL